MIRTDIVRMYRDIHSWVGVVCGLALFIAFYAGAITMFEEPLRRWASVQGDFPEPPSLAQTPRLVDALLEQRPDVSKAYRVHVTTGADFPARVSWLADPLDDDDHASIPEVYGAAFDENGELYIAALDQPPVAQFIDTLHQKVGLPLPHALAMFVTGCIALAYTVALVSGLITLLPSLAKDLFALRIGRNLKRMWLDVHNALGVFTLPFHLVMALTTVAFAFHDGFYAAQHFVVYDGKLGEQWAQGRPESRIPVADETLLAHDELVDEIALQAPGFTPTIIEYREGPQGLADVRVQGHDPRYAMRGPTFGMATVDPYTGELLQTDYLPGHQQGWAAVITQFFTLHFGSWGGNTVRWAYFVLGLAGAFMFYAGNLVWVESHRRRQRGGGETPQQSRSSRFLGSLTVGVALGCVSGVSITLAAARWLPGLVDDTGLWHSIVYYLVFVTAIAWAFLRGPARSSVDLLWFAACATALIPLSSWLEPRAHAGGTAVVDVVAIVGVVVLVSAAVVTHRRALHGPTDSVWSVSGT